MPRRAAARTGLATTSVLALSLLAASPALADDLPLQVGDLCTSDTVLPADLTCLAGLVAPAPVDAPAADPVPDPPAPDPSPTPTPDPTDPPVISIPPVDIPPVLSGGGVEIPPVADPGGAAGTPDGPTAPVQPTTDGGSATTDPTTAGGKSLHAQATTLDPASTAKSMLTAATASTLASGDLPTLGAMRSLRITPGSAGQPLSAYLPSPELANLPAATALSSVQAPLLAVGDDAANGGGFTLAGLSSRALPGLLVVLATALVATVGAGNLRYWQDRFGTRR